MKILIEKSPSIPLFQRGNKDNPPLWQRGVRGDFFKTSIVLTVFSKQIMQGELRWKPIKLQ
jgi:hypothetical protein